MIRALAHRLAARRIARHFAGTLPPAQERAMRGHLASCAACRALYDVHLLAEGEGAQAARRRRERLASAIFGPDPRVARRPSARPLAWAAPLLSAGAAAVLLLLLLPPSMLPGTMGGLREKGPGSAGASERVSVSVFQRTADGGFSRVEGRAAPDRPLAFAYTNRAGEGFDRLLLFGVDEGYTVYWYYPAWTDPAAPPPRSYPIEPSGAGVELPEAVGHSYEGSRLRIFAIFTRDRSHTVARVEGLVRDLQRRKRPLAAMERFPLERTGQHIINLQLGRPAAAPPKVKP